ncbi:ABC transporter ATP-binding protein [Poseidonibacter antarcticus]|uniref:ABC transporter ATP-binding protein n=1 Tax=Poseidonibacter antarcticus TaxID=2478538 RepID=UPI000EF5570B|nr:ABC transporter ATP-binding protein [Poseidonibacter antarcticus]
MDSSYVVFENVKKSYDNKKLVVKDFNLKVKKGEFLTMLGPSGSGKTTCLMMLAGFESITSGEISLNGVAINDIAPHKRNIGVVFQNYALFPHMTIAENLAYPLKIRKMDKELIKEKVNKSLALVELLDFEKRYPGQLSGGQKQRVALARVLIYEPEIILMDEPLGALDKQLREQMQYEIKKLHEELKLTIIYITHDQTEALTMSDRIVIFNDGIAQQIDAPMKLYEEPANSFVANFMGENNQFRGKVIGDDEEEEGIINIETKFGVIKALNVNNYKTGDSTLVSIRPEKILLSPDEKLGIKNNFKATIKDILYIGDHIRLVINIGAEKKDFVIRHTVSMDAHAYKKGDQIDIGWHRKDCRALDVSK